MDCQRGVVPLAALLGLVASPPDESARCGGEVAVALVDDVPGVAQEMGEAGLLVHGPAGLGAIAVGDPDLRADVAEEFLDRLLGAVGTGQQRGAPAVMERP